MHCRYFAAGLALLIAAPAWADDKPKDPPKRETTLQNLQERAEPSGEISGAEIRRLLTGGRGEAICELWAWALAKEKDSSKPEATYDVPYKLTDTKHVMVRVKLNGKGPFNFILDTGAPALILSETIGKKIGAEVDKKGWGKFKLEVEGGVTVPDAKGLSIDMFQLKGMNAMGVAGVELHGVIGYNILAKFRITYDFTQDKLAWTPVKFEPPDIIRINKEDGQGSLEMIGNMMKILAPLLGLRPNFEVRPRGFLGIEGEAGKACFTILTVLPDSPADKAGLKKGDMIKSVAGKSVEVLKEIQEALAKHGEGEKVKVKISRDGQTMDLDVELGKGL